MASLSVTTFRLNLNLIMNRIIDDLQRNLPKKYDARVESEALFELDRQIVMLSGQWKRSTDDRLPTNCFGID